MNSRYEWHVLWSPPSTGIRDDNRPLVEVFDNPDDAADRLNEVWALDDEAHVIPVTPRSTQ